VGRRRAGLLGSTEWAEEHATNCAHTPWLTSIGYQRRGYLDIEGSHTLEKLRTKSRATLSTLNKLSAGSATSSIRFKKRSPPNAPGDSPARRICASALSVRDPTSPHFSSTTGFRVVEHWFWWRRRRGHLPLLYDDFYCTPTSSTRICLRARALRKLVAVWLCGSPC